MRERPTAWGPARQDSPLEIGGRASQTQTGKSCVSAPRFLFPASWQLHAGTPASRQPLGSTGPSPVFSFWLVKQIVLPLAHHRLFQTGAQRGQPQRHLLRRTFQGNKNRVQLRYRISYQLSKTEAAHRSRFQLPPRPNACLLNMCCVFPFAM